MTHDETVTPVTVATNRDSDGAGRGSTTVTRWQKRRLDRHRLQSASKQYGTSLRW